MAAIALINGITTINGVDMSQYIRKVEFDIKHEDLETTNYASGGAKTRIAGLQDGSVKITFNEDFAVTTVDDRIFAILGTVVTFKAKATNAANGAANPEYQNSVLVSEMSGMFGQVGDLASLEVTWPTSGKWVRAVV
jgi:hypothetical protein